MRGAALCVLALVAVAACGSSSTASKTSPSPAGASPSAQASVTASPSGAPSASPNVTPVSVPMMVLVVRSSENDADLKPIPETVEMVDAKGHVVASANFQAPGKPYMNGCIPIPPPSVRVAAGAAYFADDVGAIHRLDPGGAVTQVASFPVNGDQFLSFAVSPDGKKLIAILFSTPQVKNPVPLFPADPYVATSTWTLDLEEANAGGPTTKVLHKDFGHSFPVTLPTLIAGWDDTGPVATLNSTVCVQNAIPSVEYTGTQLIHLGADGSHLDSIGGTACLPLDELHDGTVFCQAKSGFNYAVRTHTGAALWNPTSTVFVQEPRISPSGYGVVVNGEKEQFFYRGSSKVATITGSSGQAVALLGWFGNDQIVALEGLHIGLVSRTNTSSFIDLGLPAVAQCNGCALPLVRLPGTINV